MRALAALLVLIPVAVWAEWRAAGVAPGTVVDLQLVDAGQVMVITSTADAGVRTWTFDDAGVSGVFVPGAFIGGGVLPDGCAFGVAASGCAVTAMPGCSPLAGLPNASCLRMRLLGPELGAALVVDGANSDQFTSGPLDGGAWSSQGAPFTATSTRALQTAKLGDSFVAVVGSSTTGSMRASLDGGAPFLLDAGVGLPLREGVPFGRLGRTAVIAYSATGLRLVPDIDRPLLETPVVPAGVVPVFPSMSHHIGMATAASGAVLSPIPDPSRPASTWVVRQGVPAPMVNTRTHCLDGRTCALITAAGQVYLYENRARPDLLVDVPTSFDAGTVVRLSADAGDLDNDPIFVRWNVDGGLVTSLTADGTTADLTVPSGVCLNSITATVTDGFEAFDRSVTIPVTIIDRGVIELLAPAAPILAGAGPASFTAGLDGGCNTPTRLDWTTSDGQTGSGSQFSYVVPATECASMGRQITVTATATWSTGTPSTSSASSVITVQPWGAPSTPQFASPATQQAGTTQLWAPLGTEHVCSTSPGFPGTELLWAIDGGGLAATPVDGGLLVTAPATCEPLRLVASAVRQVVGETAGRVSDAGLLVVDVTPDLSPLGPSTPVAIAVAGDAGIVFGSIDAGVSCIDARGVSAEIVLSQGGTQVASNTVGVPSDWSFVVPGGCSGGRYEVEARLLQDGGFTGASVVGEVTLAESPVAIGALSSGRIDAQCGTGVSVDLTLEPVAGACSAAEYHWRAISGPQLEVTEGAGSSLSLQTVARDFSLVGQPIVLEWSADAGTGNTEVATRTIEIGVQPFVEVSAKANPPLRREEEPVTFEITLRNQSACAVSGLAVTVPVSGGTPLLESVLVDGVRAVAQNTPDGIFLSDVALPPSGAVLVTLSVRPRLLGDVSVTSLVALQGYVVSTSSVSGPAPTGCGCTSAAPLWSLAGLALLLLRRRTRASR
jgi:uncharacterized protein (TIGR03382 family)